MSVGMKAFGALTGSARKLMLLVGATWRAPCGDSEVLPARPCPQLWSALGHRDQQACPAVTELRLHSQIGFRVDNDAPWLPVSGCFLCAKPSAGPITRAALLESSQRQASLPPLYREGN